MALSFLRRRRRDADTLDRVTRVLDRRQLDADVAAGIGTSDHVTATLMIDVDDLDGDGARSATSAENRILDSVSWVIMSTVRTTDVVYRHGPSTFCVLLPNTSDEQARSVADRIRLNVQKMPVPDSCRSTVSVGVATGAGGDLATTIRRAGAELASGGERA